MFPILPTHQDSHLILSQDNNNTSLSTEDIINAAIDSTTLNKLVESIPQEEHSKLYNLIPQVQSNLVNLSFGMVDGIWRGATPPSGEWVPTTPGPRGGKRWKRADKSSKIFEPNKDKEGNNVRTESESRESKPRESESRDAESGRESRQSGTKSERTSSSIDNRIDRAREREGSQSGTAERREEGLDSSRVSKPVREHLKPDREYLKPEIVTARAEQTPKPDIRKVPESLHKYLISPDGKKHQLEGVAMAINAIDTTGGFLLADGAGAGKTRIMLGIAKTYSMKDKKAILVAPAGIIKPNWKDNSVVGSVGKDAQAMGIELKLNKGDKPIKAGEVHVTTYEQLAEMKNQIDKDTVVIFDEAHGLKNAESARSQHGREVASRAMGVVYGSATPADSVKDISYLFRTKLFGDEPWESVRKKFNVNKLGAMNVLKNVSDIFDKLTENGIMIKREISLDGVEANFDHVELPQEMKIALDAIKDQPAVTKAQLLMRQRFAQERFKIPHTVDLIDRELSEGRQVIVFVAGVGAKEGEKLGTAGILHNEISKLGLDPDEIVELHGSEGGGGREVVEAFQKGNAKVLITTAQSGGTGHNFDDTVGDTPRTQIIMTPPFSAIDNSQIWGRTHRLTTRSSSRMHYVFADTEVDKWNANLIKNKMAALSAIVGGESEKQAIPNNVAASVNDSCQTDAPMGLIDGEWHGRVPPSYGEWVITTPGPRGGMIWRRVDAGNRRRRSGNVGSGNAISGRVEETSRRSTDTEISEYETDQNSSTNNEIDYTATPKQLVKITRRIKNFAKHYRKKGSSYEEISDWFDSLADHINESGVEAAIRSLPTKLPEDYKQRYVQYQTTRLFDKWEKEDINFIRNYLKDAGITYKIDQKYHSKNKLISPAPAPRAIERNKEGDIVGVETPLETKLDESKLLPGLESSEDISVIMGREVDAITDDVIEELDRRFGEGKWLVKSYGYASYAGFGIFFPEYINKIKEDAQQNIAEAEEVLNNNGFSVVRVDGVTTGIMDDNTEDVYNFDTKEYSLITNSEARKAGGQIFVNLLEENGPSLPQNYEDILRQKCKILLREDNDGNVIGITTHYGEDIDFGTDEYEEYLYQYDRDFADGFTGWTRAEINWAVTEHGVYPYVGYMAQPAFPAIGVSEYDRALGRTWETSTEGRVHVATRDGKATVVPYATLANRNDSLPAVFYDDEVRAMEAAVQETFDKLPEEMKVGQTYAPDVMKTEDGWRVVEMNASTSDAQSLWLEENPIVIDSYVSHVLGREPAHVRFIRRVINEELGVNAKLSIDIYGREHRGKGPGGGQFISRILSKILGSKSAQPELSPSKAKVKIRTSPYNKKERLKELTKLFFGYNGTKQDFATIVAAPDDAELTIDADLHNNIVNIRINHDKYEAKRSLVEDGNGNKWIYNNEMFVKPKYQNSGIGLEIFLKQVNNASVMGIPAIYANAASGIAQDGKTKMNGYYTLPRYGYDVKLTNEHIDNEVLDEIKKVFPKAKTIQDIMKTEKGRDWWKENGDTIYDMKFDTRSNSKSMRMLNAYLTIRRKRDN